MCIAILNKSKVTLSKKLLQNCWTRNKDGGGLMYAVDKKLHIYKSMGRKQFIKEYFRVRKKHPDTDIVLHFRWSTHGKDNLDNTHPHIVNPDVAMVHNGVIDNVVELHRKEVQRYSKKENKMATVKRFVSDHSDTALFAKMLEELPADFMSDDVLLELIKNYIEDDNKLIFLNRDGESVIINEEAGVWESGCWFSNYGFLSDAEMKKREAEEDEQQRLLDQEEDALEGRYYPYQGNLYDDDWAALDRRSDKKPSDQGCCVKSGAPLETEAEFYERYEYDPKNWDDEAVCDYCIAPTYTAWEQTNSCCRACFNAFNGIDDDYAAMYD